MANIWSLNKENLLEIMSELRNINTFDVTESVNINGYSMNIKNISEDFDNFIEEIGVTKLKEIDSNLESLLKKCENDNDLAKKTITLTRLDLIKELIEANLSCGEKLLSFVSKSFSSGEDLNNTFESVEKTLKNIYKLTTDVFSFKDEYNTYKATSECRKMLKYFNDMDDIIDLFEEMFSEIKKDENELNDFNAFRHDNKIGDDPELNKRKDNCGRIHHKLKKFNELISTYVSQTKTIYKKSFDVILKVK